MERLQLPQFVKGFARACAIPEGLPWQQWPRGPLTPNLALYDSAVIAANLLRGAPNGKAYQIGGMYVEFDNSGSPVTGPTYDRGNALSYYNQLNNEEPTRDYLRIPLIATAGEVSDAELYSGENLATFYGQTQGVVGIHGLTFSDAEDSRVYGVSLVAFLDAEDASQDLIFSRVYFASDNQIVKPLGGQVAITWPLLFG
jgi:hypothetical protein